MPAPRKDKTICTKCGGHNDRKQPWCRKCQNECSRKWAKENRDKRVASLKKYDSSERGSIKASEWRERNKEHVQQSARAKYLANREKIILRSAERKSRRRMLEPDVMAAEEREQAREWREANPEKSKEVNRKQHRTRYYTDSAYRLRKRMRGQINRMFRRYLLGKEVRGRHWESLLGYTCADLEARLRLTLPSGYTWDDFMAGELQIDHIRPVASFDIKAVNSPEFRECWALTNLQLLPEFDNKSKGARLDWQPATT